MCLKSILRVFVLILWALSSSVIHSEPNAQSDWNLLGNGFEMQHHSELAQIHRSNVQDLGLAWVADIPGLDGLVGNPLVRNGTVFQSGSLGRVFAHRLSDGALLWTYEPTFEYENLSLVAAWASRYNRGVALHGDKVIVATGDCRIIALSQSAGEKIWESQTCDPRDFYGITAAPRVSDQLIFTGNACMDTGVTRGFVDALDAETGKRVWRFYTVPSEDSELEETPFQKMVRSSWGTKNVPAAKGCGSVWDAMTYDPVLNQLYIGVAGPAPFDPSLRASDAGDELFTNSIVALNASTGEYVWHFKQVPNDGWNFDSAVGIMVIDLPQAEGQRRAVVSVPKNGFVYLLDAQTGDFISGDNYVPVNWASGLDAAGRPVPAEEAKYWLKGDDPAIVMPGPMGAHNWEALAYDADNTLLFIPASIQPFEMKSEQDMLVGGITADVYYGLREDAKWKAGGQLIAWDLLKQQPVWSHPRPLPSNGGVLHTAGGLVFQGSADGFFTVLDSSNGKVLWEKFIGGTVKAAPTTVTHEGEQYVLIPSGNASSSAGPPVHPPFSVTQDTLTAPKLLAFKLKGTAAYPEGAAEAYFPKPLMKLEKNEELFHSGRELYHAMGCGECHGGEVYSLKGSVPDLRVSMSYLDLVEFKKVVIGGDRQSRGMPKYDFLDPQQAEQIYFYINTVATEASNGTRRPLSVPVH